MMSTDHTEALPSGYELLEYRLQKVIGEGGFGITYLAYDGTLDCQVAIKEYLPIETARRAASAYTVRPRSSNTEGDFNWGLEQFLEEARRLNRLNHPNIIRVRRFFKENGTAYLVMDYADGPTLETWLQQHGRLSYDDTADLLRPLLDGLDHVHRNSYLHRDIKPDNIILRGALQLGVRNPVLIDFGAARQAIGARTHKLTTLVSAGYSPLEQYASNRPQTPAGDIYAMAGVAYRCLTGLEPQPSPDRSLDDNLPGQLQQLDGQVPEACLAAIEKALSLKAQDRQQSVAAFRESLFPDEPEAQAQSDQYNSPTPQASETTEAALEQQGEESGPNRSQRARSKGTVKYSAELEVTELPSEPRIQLSGARWKSGLANFASFLLKRLPHWAHLRKSNSQELDIALPQPQENVSRNQAALGFASLAFLFAYVSSFFFLLQMFVVGDDWRSNANWQLSQAFLYFPFATFIAAFLSHRLFRLPQTRFAVIDFLARIIFSVLSYLFVTVWSTSLYEVHLDGVPASINDFVTLVVVGLQHWDDMLLTAQYSFLLFFILYFALCMNLDKGLSINPGTLARLPKIIRMALVAVLSLFVVLYFAGIINERESNIRTRLESSINEELTRFGYSSARDFVSGIDEKKLKEMIKGYQKKHGLLINGEASEALLEHLRQAPTKINWVVSKGGDGDSQSIQAALDAITSVDNALRTGETNKDTPMTYRILLKPGVYKENLSVTCGEYQQISVEGLSENDKAVIEGGDGKDSAVIYASCSHTNINNVTVTQKNNAGAVYFAGPGKLSISNSVIRSPKPQWAVYVDGPKSDATEGAKGKASINITNSEVWGGIGLSGRMDGNITGNNLTAPAGYYALGFYGAATPTIENNNISNISISDEAAPMLIGNRISATKGSAVQIMGDGMPTLRDNRIRTTDGNCINIDGATGITTIENNVLDRCGSYPAIAVSEKAKAIIRNNQIVPDAAGEPYIYVKEGAQVTSSGNTALGSSTGAP